MIPFPVDRLWSMIAAERISIIWYPDNHYPRGRYCVVNGHPFLFLSPFVKSTTMRLRCSLAHELGHHFAGFGSGNEERDDERAMRWAYDLVLPHWWLNKRLHWELWRIAEEADVYQEWVEAQLQLIHKRKGLSRREAVSSF